MMPRRKLTGSNTRYAPYVVKRMMHTTSRNICIIRTNLTTQWQTPKRPRNDPMLPPATESHGEDVCIMTKESTECPAPSDIASLNADGTRNWIIPPYVIPAVIIALVLACATYRVQL